MKYELISIEEMNGDTVAKVRESFWVFSRERTYYTGPYIWKIGNWKDAETGFHVRKESLRAWLDLQLRKQDWKKS